MAAETTEAIRQAGQLQKILSEYRIFLETRSDQAEEIYGCISDVLFNEFEGDHAKMIEYIRLKLDWPLTYKHHHLLRRIREHHFHQLPRFVFSPSSNFKQTRSFRPFHLQAASIERQYGSAVSSILHLQYSFFLLNLFTLILWLALIILPYSILSSSSSSSSSSFSFSTFFTTKDYLSHSVFFQGFYSTEMLTGVYNLPLIYFLSTYLYFFVWFVFLTVRFASTYKQKVLDSILNSKLGIGFPCTFGRWSYTIHSKKEKEKYVQICQRQFLDLIGNDERLVPNRSFEFRTWTYKWKLIVTNCFYVLIAVISGGVNWWILSTYDHESFVDRAGSIVFLALINRLMPYVIAILTQMESYKYLSYKLDAVSWRCILVNICTILSFLIFFFLHSPPCYETVYGQFLYILLLADLFASLIFPFVFGIVFDFICQKTNRDFDGINIHVQITPPVLLYSQFLIWLGTYFSPLLSILVLINLIFSYLSHRLYFYYRSHQTDSFERVFIWNASRLKYLIYLIGYVVLIISVTCFVVYTTQIKPSEQCGPFRHLNASYEIVGKLLEERQTSVVWASIINFLTSPGFSYFLVITFSVVIYKFRHEGLAEKQLVFIRENNLESKKRLRENVVKKLHGRGRNVAS